MKYSKSLEEVWEWKRKIYEDRKKLSIEDYLKKTDANAKKFYKEHNLKLKKAA